ncbi:acyl-CoA dehydrogenase family protein [Hydrogenibacillus schlegelii]|uniref:acyl-CoA dehydrogenase family protein n=1 Tax=Hydrogenibacillus schlegelii TaxID=1484 RepID=UPI002352814B|nr:acyl-CoA dehydrogenase family protein [Hydrogenibacillus schlegelii]
MLTADYTVRRGRRVPLKATLDGALQGLDGIEWIVVARRFPEEPVPMGGRDVGLWASMAKLLASETAFRAVDQAIQTHGGNGFGKEYRFIQMLAPARLMKTAPVNNEMLLNFIAERALDLPRSY